MSYFAQADFRGKSSIVLADESPKWMHDAVKDAHQGTPPCDWVYKICRYFFDGFEKHGYEDTEEFLTSFVSNCASNKADVVAQWYSEHCLMEFVVNAKQRMYGDEKYSSGVMDIDDQLIELQRIAIFQIAAIILAAWRNNM
jgi:hypothetical protein